MSMAIDAPAAEQGEPQEIERDLGDIKRTDQPEIVEIEEFIDNVTQE